MASTEKQIRWPAIPYYGAAAVWTIWAAFFNLYKIGHFVIVICLSVAVFWLLRILMQRKTVKEEISPAQIIEGKSTGNMALDSLLREGETALQEMHRFNRRIQEPGISANIDRMESTTRSIFEHIRNNPQKVPQIRRFMDYYIPTTLKLLNMYDQMNTTGISGQNINTTKMRITDMMKLIADAFEAQLDSLFGSDALDISADITALEAILKQENLLVDDSELQLKTFGQTPSRNEEAADEVLKK